MTDASQPERLYERLLAEWNLIETASERSVAEWEATYRDLVEEQVRLTRAGRWLEGPSDVMGVLGINGQELAHSRVVAWLLDPRGRHGLGTRLSEALLGDVWSAEDRPEVGAVRVYTEVPQVDPDSGVQTFADVVIEVADATVVVENKVFAEEHAHQCERLYRAWTQARDDVRFLLLSPDGRRASTAHSEAARQAWQSLAYRRLGELLELCLARSNQAPGRSTARNYLITLRGMGWYD
jgi:hypothetical protein